jgi:hypothetical protein
MHNFKVKIITKIEMMETTIDLAGMIDERAGYKHWGVVPPSKVVRVNCRAIDGINAAGIRSWLQFFGGLRARHVPLAFEDVPLALLELLVAVPELMLEEEVRSAWV